MSEAIVKSIDSVHEFAHDLSEIGEAFSAATGRVASETFLMDSLAMDCVSRVYSGWQQAIMDLEAAESEYNSYAGMDPGEEQGQVDLTEYLQAVREAAAAERDAREDYNAIVSLQASLKGYTTQLYSDLAGVGNAISADLEAASHQISSAAMHLDDYSSL